MTKLRIFVLLFQIKYLKTKVTMICNLTTEMHVDIAQLILKQGKVQYVISFSVLHSKNIPKNCIEKWKQIFYTIIYHL